MINPQIVDDQAKPNFSLKKPAAVGPRNPPIEKLELKKPDTIPNVCMLSSNPWLLTISEYRSITLA